MIENLTSKNVVEVNSIDRFNIFFNKYQEDFQNECDEIKKSYSINHTNSDNEAILILKLENLNEIISKFNGYNSIDWEKTILQLPIPLENAMIRLLLLKHSIKWTLIVINVRNNIYTLIDEFKDQINWWSVQKFSDIIWEENLIEKYCRYLIFTKKVINQQGEIGKFSQFDEYRGYCYSKHKKYAIEQTYGKEYDEKTFFTISESPNVKWTIELINKFENYWDWDQLSSNHYIPFNLEIIEAFQDSWNWTLISSNRSIHWDVELLQKFKSKICPKGIATNNNVDWNNALFLFRSPDFDWKMYSLNRAFNVTLLEIKNKEYWKKIIWKKPSKGQTIDIRGHYYFKKDNPYLISKIESDNYFEEFWTYHKKYKFYIEPSLSANTNIEWTDEIISKHFNKLDFWMIALRGILSVEIVLKYAAYFDEMKYIHKFSQKNSDWPNDDILVYTTGWENLAMNPNFEPNEEFFSFASSRYVRKIQSINIGAYQDRQFSNQHVIPNEILDTEKGEWLSVEEIFKTPYWPLKDIKIDYSKL